MPCGTIDELARIQLRSHPGRQSAHGVDPDRIQQAMWSLLANAVKFTPRGGRITLPLRVNPTDLLVSVLPHVFQRFRQG